MKDVAIIGAGVAGMATATRLQRQGFSTIVFEAHGQPGGCAGFYRRKGFAFDVGATTLVDFAPGGVGDEWLASIGMPPVEGEQLPGYVAWLPDRVVTLHRHRVLWANERLKVLGNTPAHRAFWRSLDRLAHVFWQASRNGVKLPIQNIGDILHDIRALGPAHLPLVRYLNWTVADALRAFGLREDRALVGLLSMLIEDTVHSSVEQAPLVNAALGITIRGAGLTRARGGMRGFSQVLVAHYRSIGGVLCVGCRVEQITGEQGDFLIKTRRGIFQAAQVVSALPAELTARLRPFIGLACYCITVYFGQWWLAPIIVFLIFVAVVTVTHDVVHRSLGMTQRQTAWALFLMGSVLMESGHAYRTTHVQHHKYFPADKDEDPEGYPAHIGLLGAIFYGPVFLYRLWWWAFRRNKKRTGQRVWMIVEVLIPIIVFTTGIFLWKTMPAILVYAVLALVGSWVYPLLTVYLPHKDFGDTPLTQTHTLRGKSFPPSSWNSPITWNTIFIPRCPATTSPNSLAASIPSSKRRVCSTGMSFREEKAFAKAGATVVSFDQASLSSLLYGGSLGA